MSKINNRGERHAPGCPPSPPKLLLAWVDVDIMLHTGHWDRPAGSLFGNKDSIVGATTVVVGGDILGHTQA